MRILLCTFGYDPEKIIKAMRVIRNEGLVIVTGKDNTERSGFKDIIDLANLLGTPVESVLVDKFDFMVCFQTIDGVIKERRSNGDEIVVNMSGGVPLLSNAALLAAFNNGCEAYFVDDVVRKMPTMLPILKVSFKELLSPDQKAVLLGVIEGMVLPDPRSMGKKDAGWFKTMKDLKDMGLIKVDTTMQSPRIFLTENGRLFIDWIRR